MKHDKQALLRWPESILGPRPGLKELNVFCWGLFVLGLIFPLCFVLFIRWRLGVRFSSLLPIDFIYFYGIGHILNQHPAVQLYDYGLQAKTFDEIYHLTANNQIWGRSPYPPFVAKFFSIYARFSFEQAYFLWMGTSFVLYIAGIAAAVKAALPRDPLKGSLIFCFALASPLFLYFNLTVGQLATVAVFSVGFAVYLEKRSMLFFSGMALSILTYKPTLLLLIVPMLLL
ncbi:MAG: glycosyltransferase family 87 protein, partial [Terracidiphilus sp.]